MNLQRFDEKTRQNSKSKQKRFKKSFCLRKNASNSKKLQNQQQKRFVYEKTRQNSKNQTFKTKILKFLCLRKNPSKLPK